MSRVQQVKQAFQMTRQADPQVIPWMLGAFFAGFIVFFLLGLLLGSIVLAVLFGLLAGPIVALIVFGRRATKVQLGMLEGQPGAAIALLQQQKGFLVTPAIAFNKRQDMVHLVVGRCGVILVGEGRQQGVKTLLKQEEQKMRRVSGDAPIHVMSVGDAEGQVSLGDVRVQAMKYKRALGKDEMYSLHQKLEAVAQKFQPKMPGGPMHQKRPKIR